MARKPRLLLLVMAIVALGAGAARAENIGQPDASGGPRFYGERPASFQTRPAGLASSSEQRLTELEAELAALKNRVGQPSLAEWEASCQPCDPCRSSGLYAGYTFLFAKPHLKESFRATSFSLATGVFSLVPFSHDYDPTPRVWLGYVGQAGQGVRARYWQYDHDGNPLLLQSDPTTVVGAHSVTVIFPAQILSADPGEILRVVNGLEVHTFDLEGTQRLELGCMSVVVGGGIRYASLEQGFGAVITDAGVPEQQLSWTRRFEGWGPTGSVEMERPIGGWGLAAVGSVHGSLLFGKKELSRFVNPPTATSPPFIVFDDADEVVGCGGLEIGLQWSRPLANCGSLFVRGTYEAQLWADAGAPTLTFLGFEGFGLALGLAR